MVVVMNYERETQPHFNDEAIEAQRHELINNDRLNDIESDKLEMVYETHEQKQRKVAQAIDSVEQAYKQSEQQISDVVADENETVEAFQSSSTVNTERLSLTDKISNRYELTRRTRIDKMRSELDIFDLVV